ncbi:hypothetical protein WJX75_007058 [Coccomyxa subellipsoidea]|uniref:Uncharacterized protein n=1 Tax=Coccomyxa subellipsoidea TaxID=248742 RepID=A0ABR2YRS8_9CHLO
MPLTVRDGALLAAGMWFAGASTFFYRRKQTLPFKVAYFLSWPTLGSAVILVMTPSEEKMKQALAKTGTADRARVEEMRQLTQLQLDKIKQAAAQGKEPGSSTQSWQQTVDSVRRDDSG